MGKQSRAKEAEQLREIRRRREEEERNKKRKQNRTTGIAVGVVVGMMLVAVLAVIIATVANQTPKMSQIDLSDVADASAFTETSKKTNYVRLSVSYTAADGTEKNGDIYVRLFPKVAPKTVKNFQSLVASGYYNGTVFHRVYPGFMIQGGSGDAAKIAGEFASNGFENNLQHVRGVLSMARADSPDSASSQFFIIHQTASHLDGNYAAFGYVVNGMDVVDAITQVELSQTAGSIDAVATSPVYPVTITSAVFVTK